MNKGEIELQLTCNLTGTDADTSHTALWKFAIVQYNLHHLMKTRGYTPPQSWGPLLSPKEFEAKHMARIGVDIFTSDSPGMLNLAAQLKGVWQPGPQIRPDHFGPCAVTFAENAHPARAHLQDWLKWVKQQENVRHLLVVCRGDPVYTVRNAIANHNAVLSWMRCSPDRDAADSVVAASQQQTRLEQFIRDPVKNSPWPPISSLDSPFVELHTDESLQICLPEHKIIVPSYELVPVARVPHIILGMGVKQPGALLADCPVAQYFGYRPGDFVMIYGNGPPRMRLVRFLDYSHMETHLHWLMTLRLWQLAKVQPPAIAFQTRLDAGQGAAKSVRKRPLSPKSRSSSNSSSSSSAAAAAAKL